MSTVSLRLVSTVVFRSTISVAKQHRQLRSVAKFVLTRRFPAESVNFARSMSEVVITPSEMEAAEKCPTPEEGVDVAPKRPKLEIDDSMESESAAVETGVGCQCSIEAKMEPDDTSILVSFKFPDKEYDGEVEDSAQMVST
jgi:hypothetical protein